MSGIMGGIFLHFYSSRTNDWLIFILVYLYLAYIVKVFSNIPSAIIYLCFCGCVMSVKSSRPGLVAVNVLCL